MEKFKKLSKLDRNMLLNYYTIFNKLQLRNLIYVKNNIKSGIIIPAIT